MASAFGPFLPMMAVLAVFLNGPVCCLHVEVSPAVVNELITDEVAVTCRLDKEPNGILDITVIEIGRAGEQPLALVRPGGIKYGPVLEDNVQVEGHIDKDISKSYLRLTITKPEEHNAGSYFCLMYYLDGFGQFTQARAEGNVTVDNDDDRALFIQMLNKISNLEERLKEQEEKASFSSVFSAGYDENDGLAVGQKVVFRYTDINFGEDYDNVTGVFTAGKKGIYVFHLYAEVFESGEDIKILLKVNGDTAARMFAYESGSYAQGSVDAVVILKAGDRVWPEVETISDGKGILGFPHSAFMGYLLKLL